MRWRKKLLRLPADHVWTSGDWASFETLGKAAWAANLAVPIDIVQKLFRRGQHEHLVGGPLDVTERDMEEAVLATKTQPEDVLLQAMYKNVFGRSAGEDLVVTVSSVVWLQTAFLFPHIDLEARTYLAWSCQGVTV